MESDKGEGRELDKTAELELKNLINSLKGKFSFCNRKFLDEKISSKNPSLLSFPFFNPPRPSLPYTLHSSPPSHPSSLPFTSPKFLTLPPLPIFSPPLLFSFLIFFYINPPNLLFDPPQVFLDLYPPFYPPSNTFCLY